MMIICKEIDKELLSVALRLFQKWYALYRLSRHVILQFRVILGKLNKSTTAYKNKMKKILFQEYYSPPPSSSSSDDVELSNWSSIKHILPQEIIELILQRLPLNDYLQFGTVCQSWRFVIAKVIAEKRCTPAPELSLLMFCAHPYTNRNNCFLSLEDLSNNNGSKNINSRVFYKHNCPELHNRFYAGSVEGWLIISNGILWRPEGFIHDFWFEKVKNFFLNPVSGARIMLPSQTTILSPYRNRPDFFGKVVASAVPTSPNYIVAAICLMDKKLAFCRPADISWTLYKDDTQVFIDVVFHDDGILYAITLKAWNSITIFDLREFSQGCTSSSMAKLLVIRPAPSPLVGGSRRRVEGRTVYTYGFQLYHLVKDDHDLLMIMRLSDFAYDEEYFLKPIALNYTIPPRIKMFKVFKLDQSGPRWVHVPSLRDDQIVFLCQKNCVIISTTCVSVNRKLQKKEEQITGNYIYFAVDNTCTTSPQEARDVGVFSLADGSIKRHLPSVPRS